MRPDTSRHRDTARLDRAFYESASFPARMTLPVRFDDLDVQSHVNNAAAVAMLQEARIAFHRMMGLPSPDRIRTVVAAMTVEYVRELNYPGTVDIGTGIVSIGRSSYTFVQILRQDGAMAVCSRTTMVVTSANGASPIPSDLEAAIRERCLVVENGEA